MPKKTSLSQSAEEDPNLPAKSVSDSSSGKKSLSSEPDNDKAASFEDLDKDAQTEPSDEAGADLDTDAERDVQKNDVSEDDSNGEGESKAEKKSEERKKEKTPVERSRSRLEDYALIDQICGGNPHERDQAYKRLLNKYRGQIFNLILKIIHNQNEVEDLVQETFSKAFNSIENFNKEYAFSTWLYRIATNSSIDYLRKRRLKTYSLDNPITTKDDEYTIEIPDSSGEPGKNIIQSQRDALVRDAIKNLPPKYRRVIEMRHLNERTYEEIASELSLPLGTVKAHIFRAREMLYKMLRDKLRNY